MTSRALEALARVEIESASGLRDWLYCHFAQQESIWLVSYKKSADPLRYVSYDTIVDEVICFGWIDSLPRKLDETRTMLLLSPRKPGSGWSAVNKDRVERMTAAQKMHPAGDAVVEIAKQDGSWDFLNDVNALIEPNDLTLSLNSIPDARENWDKFSRSSRRGILEWIKLSKRTETRAKRIHETARLAKDGIKANH